MPDWTQYRKTSTLNTPSETPQAAPQPPMQQVMTEPDWSQFQAKPKDETFGEKVLSGTNKILARTFEKTAGLPGDVEAFIRPIIAKNQQSDKGLLGKISEKRVFPTSDELRELSKEAHKGKLEPSGETERLAGEFASDYVFAPGGPWKKIFIAGAGLGAQETAAALDMDKSDQGKIKAGVSFLTSLVGKRNVKDYYKSEYKKASRSLPVKETLDSKRLNIGLDTLEKRIKQGVHSTSKDPALSVIKELKEKSAFGNIPIRELDSAFHNINEQLLDKKNLAPGAEHWLLRTKKMVSHELNRYGVKNPEYLSHFKDANAAFGGLKQSQKATNFMNKFNKSPVSVGPSALLAEYILKGAATTTGTAAKLATAYGAVKGYELLDRIFQNKTLFHYYSKALGAAAKENTAQFTKNLSILDKKLRESNTETSRFVDFARTAKKS